MEYCLYPSYTSKNLKISKNIFCDEANSLLKIESIYFSGFEVFYRGALRIKIRGTIEIYIPVLGQSHYPVTRQDLLIET